MAKRFSIRAFFLYSDAESPWLQYGLTMLAVATAALLTETIPVIGQRSAFVFFFLAIIQTSYWLGRYPGLFALVLALVTANLLFLVPSWASGPVDAAILNISFIFVSATIIHTLSHHRQLVRKLWLNRQDFNHAQAVAKTGSWRMDINHNQLHWSDESYRIFGIPKGMPLTYDTFLATVHPEDRERVDQKWQAALSGESYEIDHRILVKGKVKWVREKAVLEFNTSGVLLGGFGTAQDITELRQNELMLVEIEQQYAGIVKSAMDAIVTIDAEQRIIVFNAAAEKMFGCTADEAIGESLERFIPERYQHTHAKHINAFGHTNISNRNMGEMVTISGLRNNGEEFPIEVSISQVVTNGHKSYTAILRDITERKRTDAILNEQLRLQDQLAKVATTLPGVICSFRVRPDGSSHMPYASPAFESITGLSREVVAKDFSPFFACIHSGDLNQVNTTTVESARSLQPWFGEFRYLHPAKGEIWLESHSMPELEPDSSILWHGYIQDITERKFTEIKLQESLARYELVLEGAQDAIWDWDVINKRVHFSTRWKALRGYSDNEISDNESEWSAAIHPDDTARVFGAVQAHFEGKAPFFCEEYRIRCKDGSWKWILDRGVAQKDSAGQVIRMAGSENDITERKRAEWDLRVRENELRLIMDAAPALIAYLDTDFRYLRVNKTYENWFCMSFKSILGKSALEIIGEKAWAIVRPYLERAKSGERVSFDYQIPYGTSKPRWVQGNYVPDKDESGVVKGIVIHVIDIEDRKQAELERQKFVSLADSSQEFISICDMNFTPFYVNKAAMRLVGLDSPEQVFQTPVQEFFFPEDQHLITEEFFPRVLREKGSEIEIRFRHFQTGTAIWMIYNVFVIEDSNGKAVGLATVSRDITARRLTEAKLHESEQHNRFLANILENCDQPFGVGSADGRLEYVNTAFERLTGFNRNELLAMDWAADLTPPEWKEAEQLKLAELQRNHQSVRYKKEYFRKDGTRIPIELMVELESNDAGQPVRYFAFITDLTERKQAAAALRDSQARLALGVQVAGLALAEVDYSTGLNHLSAEAARLFGLGEDDMVLPRETVHATFHPDDRSELMRRIIESLDPRGEGWFAMDHRVHSPDGHVRWLRVRKQVQFIGDNDDRRPLRAILAIHDITSEMNAAETLRNSESFVRNVLNSLPEHVVVLNEQGEVSAVNEPWHRFASANGGSPSAVSIGANYLEVCRNSTAAGDPYAHQALEGLEDLFAGRKQEFVMEYPCPTTSGLLWFLLHAKRVFHNPDGIILTHVDISDRKHAEDALLNAQARLTLVVEEVKVGYWDLDLLRRSLYVSPEWKYQLGIDEHEPLNDLNKWHSRLHPDDKAFFLQATEDYIAGNVPMYELDYRLRHQDGTYRWIHSRGVLMRNPNQQPFRLLGLNLDITDYKLSNELNSRRNMMEQTFRLYVASQTAAAIAHELNQPLTAISYYADVAQELLETGSRNTHKLSEIMGKCSQQALRAGGVIRQLMTILHKGEAISESIDINVAVMEAVNFVKTDGQLGGFKIQQDLTPHIPLVTANNLQVQKILINLLHNSLESMREVGVDVGTISITTRAAAEDSSIVLVSVCDSGKGVVDIAMLKTMFQPFYSTKPKGLGMGLAISRALIEAHNGKMWAEQNTGPGLTIHFTLPFAI